ncbi:MAG TPA: hypothetical protein VGM89_20440, partial [Puia sp.]
NLSSNLALPVAVSSVTGFNNIWGNSAATILNKGFEVELNSVNINSTRFKWSTSVNVSIPENKLLAFPGLAVSDLSDVLALKKSIFGAWAYRFAGINPQNGLYQFYDDKGNLTQFPNAQTDKTRYIDIGRRWFGGLQNKFTWGNFYLDLLVVFVKQYGQTAFGFLYRALPPGSLPAALTPEVLKRWRSPGDVTDVQRMQGLDPLSAGQVLQAAQRQNDAANSTRAYGDASFARLRNVALGFNCPHSWLQKSHIEAVRFYLAAENLITFTHYLTFDPENMASPALPPLRTIALGLSVTL